MIVALPGLFSYFFFSIKPRCRFLFYFVEIQKQPIRFLFMLHFQNPVVLSFAMRIIFVLLYP